MTEAQQASYLRKACRMAATHPQIKLLLWFLDRDVSPTGTSSDPNGTYLGLRRLNGSPKPAWYAFAGGNRLSLAAPAVVRRGVRVRLHGRLTCATVGGLPGKRLVVWGQRAAAAARRHAASPAAPAAITRQPQGRAVTQRLRVIWTGVVSSRIRLLLTR